MNHVLKGHTLNHHRFHPFSLSVLLMRWSQLRVTPDTKALLAYGLVVILGVAAMLIATRAPFAHVPMGI